LTKDIARGGRPVQRYSAVRKRLALLLVLVALGLHKQTSTSIDGSSSPGGVTAPWSSGSVAIAATNVAQRTKSTKKVPASFSATGSLGQCPLGLVCVPIKPTGGDDTATLQKSLNSTASSRKVTEMTAGTYHLSPIKFPSNAYLVVDAGVLATDNPGYSRIQAMLNINASSNVKIVGAGASVSVFQMPNSFAASAQESANCAADDAFCSQYRHCLLIESTNVTVSGISCNQSGGDGLYIARASNVTVSDSIFSGNFRNGGSLIGQTRHINITGNQFINQRNFAGAGIADGFDVEPNHPSDFVEDVNFTNNVTSGNQLDGFCMCMSKLDSTSLPVSITVTGNKSDNNDRYGYFVGNSDASPGGTVAFNSSSTANSGAAGAIGRFMQVGGWVASFNDLTVTNPNRLGGDPNYGFKAGVAVHRGGGAAVKEGNVQFIRTNISATDGKTDWYLWVGDGSRRGWQNIVFDGLGKLSGANKTPNCMVMGKSMNAIISQ
jgi:hypothetical protein